MPNDPRPTKAQRQSDARARAAEMRRQQESAAKRNRILAIGGAVLAVLVLVGAVVFVVVQNHQNAVRYGDVAYGGADADTNVLVAPALTDVKAPSTANATGGIPVSDEGVGKAGDGDTVLQVYFDMQCPVCQAFDQVNSADLQALAREPGITVVYQPMSFLDYMSQNTHYSNRAINALMTVADQDPDHFESFMTALYVNQPAENSKGITDDKIASIAAGVGVPQAVIDQFTTTVSGTYQVLDPDQAPAPAATGGDASSAPTLATTQKTATWRVFTPFVKAATEYAAGQPVFPNGKIGTPTVVLDGTQITNDVWSQPGALKAQVEAAAAAKG